MESKNFEFLRSRSWKCLSGPIPKEKLQRDSVGTKQGPSRHQAGTKLSLSEDQANLLRECQKPLSLLELMQIFNRSDRTKFRRGVISPLLEMGVLEMTDPENPKNPNQKYRTTEQGKKLIEEPR